MSIQTTAKRLGRIFAPARNRRPEFLANARDIADYQARLGLIESGRFSDF